MGSGLHQPLECAQVVRFEKFSLTVISSWFTDLGGSSGLTCNAMLAPFGGTISYSNGAIMGPFNDGTTATLRCNSGFPQGKHITCFHSSKCPVYMIRVLRRLLKHLLQWTMVSSNPWNVLNWYVLRHSRLRVVSL